MEEREIKEQAIVLKNEDVGDADRMVTLLTLGHGKIKAKMKGVKKSKAKLAYASFPFNFGEYMLVKTGRSYTVTNCSFIDNFGGLILDLNLYYAGAGILEIAGHLSKEGEDSYSLFMAVLKVLKELSYNENVNVFTALSRFLVEVLELSGFKLSSAVEEILEGGAIFNFSLGKLSNEVTEDDVLLEKEDANALNSLILGEEVLKTSKSILKLLILFYENKVDEEITILKKFI